MKRILAVAGALLLAAFSLLAVAQPSPGNFAQRYAVAGYPTQIVATGAQPSVRGLNVGKTYQVTGQTTAGAGSAVVSIEGSNDTATWDNIGTVTLTLGVTTTSLSFTSVDRYMFVRANAGTLSGTGAAYTAWMGY